jgi:hypothetical protein
MYTPLLSIIELYSPHLIAFSSPCCALIDSVIISLHVTALPLFHFSNPAFNADCLIFSLVAYERGIPLLGATY